ncbi:MAG TPA: uroporphyrinogen decarboxylase [Bacteroidota bacterium]|nr:uroporphyrinogen decarboxylase [Bacteroidota bacterium]
MNDLFLRACKRQAVSRTPVWLMRQAGRYLPEYRAVRAKADFLTMCKTPELAVEVTLQPVDLIGVDAAIIFSDILVVPAAMGMPFEMAESVGPRFASPLRTRADVEALQIPDPARSLRFVLDALELAKRSLGGRVPLIGFSGAPWTLATYMVEGRGSRDYQHISRMMLDDPETFSLLMDKLTRAVQLYLEAQLAAGADAVQIFDTWAGVLPPDHFRKWSLDPIERIVSRLHRDNEPVIVFCKGANHSLRELAQIGADVVSLDWTVDMAIARELTDDKVALQGNLNPSYLYASPERIRREVRSILQKYGPHTGHIFNLGHGVFPDVPVDNVRAMVRAVHEESLAFHKG